MKNSQGFPFTALADFLMACVEDNRSFPNLKIKISKAHKVALLYFKYSLEKILLADFSWFA